MRGRENGATVISPSIRNFAIKEVPRAIGITNTSQGETNNRVGTNNFWMSAACSYYAEYYKYSPEGVTVSSHLTIQNNP
ncbi:hypothetical protein [Paenibacillus chitinolyticus]|uniref:hypothetical protein n=1 Tax=Paenibacillus chitinolyticus TaxID=79263 RepID=UPI0036734894